MAFEGEHKVIPIKGIARAGADTVCEDGAMNEVIGLEYKDGSYVPYAGTQMNVSLPENTKSFYIHKGNDSNVLIVTRSRTLLWQSESDFNNGSQAYKSFNPSITNVVDVEFVGNMLCVSTDYDMVQYIYDSVKKDYVLYNSRRFFDYLPTIRFKVSRYEKDFPMEGDYNSGNTLYVRDEFRFSTYAQDQNGYIPPIQTVPNLDTDKGLVAILARKAQSILAEQGRIFGYVVAIGAYKLKNGEYVRASAPVLLSAPNAIESRVLNNDFASGRMPLFFPAELYKDGSMVFKQMNKHLGSLENWSAATEASFSDGNICLSPQSVNWISPSTSEKKGYVSIFNYDVRIPSIFAWFNNTGSALAGFESYQSYAVGMMGNILQYDFDPIELENFKERYERVIDSYCIFLSPEISYYNDFIDKNISMSKKIIRQAGSYYTASYTFQTRTNEQIFEDIGNIQNFYKVHEIPFTDICKHKTGTYKNVDLKGKLGDNLYLQDTLPISAFNYDSYVNGILKSYNYRLHHARYIQELFGGYSGEQFSFYQFDKNMGNLSTGQYGLSSITPNEDFYNPYVNIRVLIKDEQGDTEVWTSSYLNYALNPLISYPNKNAYRLEIYFRESSSKWYSVGFDLRPSKFGGFAYYVDTSTPNIGYINISNPEDKLEEEVDGLTSSVFQPNNAPVIKNVNSSRLQNNKLRVSDTNFVDVFDYKNYHNIGNETITKLASLSISLSQDTYGKYPILIFCTDGIYSLGVDATGAKVYIDNPPFSREVCINPNTVCEIDGAVLFASSKGLMLASSQGVQEFLPALNGKPKHLPEEYAPNKCLGLVWYKDIISSDTSTQMSDYVSKDNFIEFLLDKDTTVSYVSEKNKVIVYNQTKNYSYWIDVPTRNVTKLPVCIKMDNNDYPTEQYVTDNDSIVTFNFQPTDGDVQCLLQTRPIKTANTLISTLRVVVRGYFTSDNPDKYVCMLVLGSYDAINWQPIGYKTRQFNGGFNDLGCVTDRVSCKYVMVIVTGNMNSNSHIDGIELTKNSKYNNKLR